jgi:hypothetical protein
MTVSHISTAASSRKPKVSKWELEIRRKAREAWLARGATEAERIASWERSVKAGGEALREVAREIAREKGGRQ